MLTHFYLACLKLWLSVLGNLINLIFYFETHISVLNHISYHNCSSSDSDEVTDLDTVESVGSLGQKIMASSAPSTPRKSGRKTKGARKRQQGSTSPRQVRDEISSFLYAAILYFSFSLE